VRVFSHKNTSDQEIPVFDIKVTGMLQLFAGLTAQQVCIVILALHAELTTQERLARMKAPLQSGETLTIGSLFQGGGVRWYALRWALVPPPAVVSSG
jgi:hypothetical protein